MWLGGRLWLGGQQMVVEIYREGDGVEEDVEKKEAKQEGGGSREIRFRGNYV